MRVRDLGLNVGIAALYWLIAELTRLPSLSTGRIAPLWPATGVALAAVLILGPRLLPGIAAGVLLSSARHTSTVAALLVTAGMVLQLLTDTRLLRRFSFDPRLERIRDPLVLAGVALFGAGIAAAIGAFSLQSGLTGEGATLDAFLLWWMRDWLGAILSGSLVLTWARSKPIEWTGARIAEACGISGATLLVGQVLLGVWATSPQTHFPALMLFPMVGYIGMRFGPAGSASLVTVVALFASAVAALRIGPFGTLPAPWAYSIVSLFLLLVWLSGQVLAAVRAEWEDAMQRRIALEEQLRHAQKMEAVGRLAGGIAHDFNNLLTAIIGYTEIVMVSLGPDDPARSDAEEVARAAMRAADLTRQMLVFSRKQNLQPRIIDLNVTLAKVEPMLRRLIGEDIRLVIAPKATRAQVRVDPGQIEQVIMNLVVNARDAMPRGGRLTVETADLTPDAAQLPADAPPESCVMLAVSDTGIGMPADVRARIFEPYFTTKEVGKGTGLGLSTAYGIVRQSDGHIQVYSEPGQGTTFRIYLPCTADAAPAPAVRDQAMPGGTEHILLVEDDPSVRRLSREVLARLGYSVTEAASGRAGLALGSDDTRHFDLALCDVILGDMSGPAVHEALRALRPNVRVLYMSGYADEAIVKTGVLDEGWPFLQKPFTPRDLAVTIRDVLDGRGEEREDH